MEYKDDDERESHVQLSFASTSTSTSTSTTTSALASTKTYLNMTAHGVQVAALVTKCHMLLCALCLHLVSGASFDRVLYDVVENTMR